MTTIPPIHQQTNGCAPSNDRFCGGSGNLFGRVNGLSGAMAIPLIGTAGLIAATLFGAIPPLAAIVGSVALFAMGLLISGCSNSRHVVVNTPATRSTVYHTSPSVVPVPASRVGQRINISSGAPTPVAFARTRQQTMHTRVRMDAAQPQAHYVAPAPVPRRAPSPPVQQRPAPAPVPRRAPSPPVQQRPAPAPVPRRAPPLPSNPPAGFHGRERQQGPSASAAGGRVGIGSARGRRG